MKIKLAYPKIPDTLHCPLKQCVAFEKVDGTNIHFVWDPYNGWHGFGTRRDRFPYVSSGLEAFEQAHPELKRALALYPSAFGSDGIPIQKAPLLWDPERKLDKFIGQYYKGKEVIVFTEYAGPNSFAGSHAPKDKEQMGFTLLDVQVDGRMLPPEEFIELFEPFGVPKVVFRGKFTGQLFMDVRNGKYPVKEGVVVKGVVNDQVYMAKIKTKAYLKKLKETFQDEWQEYWE